MKSIIVITPSNIEVEYRLAGVGSRLAAFIIDFIIQILLITVFTLVVLLGIDYGIYKNEPSSGTALGVVLIFIFIVQFGYFIIFELATRGQSIGKRIFSLRVIRDNGQPIGFAQSLLRGLIRASLDMIYVGLIMILFSKKHKRLGDMAAGTIVICERKETFEESLSSTVPYWPAFLPDRLLITPEERQITEEWLYRRNYMSDGGAAVGDKLIKYFEKYKNTENENG